MWRGKAYLIFGRWIILCIWLKKRVHDFKFFLVFEMSEKEHSCACRNQVSNHGYVIKLYQVLICKISGTFDECFWLGARQKSAIFSQNSQILPNKKPHTPNKLWRLEGIKEGSSLRVFQCKSWITIRWSLSKMLEKYCNEAVVLS